MSSKDDLTFDINAKDNSTDTLKDVANQLASVQDNVQELAGSLKSLNTGLETAQKGLSGASKQTKEFSEAVVDAASANKQLRLQGINQEFTELTSNIKNAVEQYRSFAKADALGKVTPKDWFKASGLDADMLDVMRKGRAASKADPLRDDDARIKAAQQANAAEIKFAQQKRDAELAGIRAVMQLEGSRHAAAVKDAQQRESGERTARAAELKGLREVITLRARSDAEAVKSAQDRAKAAQLGAQTSRQGELAAMRNELIAGAAAGTRFAGVTGQVTTELRAASAAAGGFDNSLANTRYALHDLSMTAGLMGTAIMGGLALGTTAVIDYETAIADIQRTSEMSAGQAAAMRDEFAGLASEIPLAFRELAQIGELGGQLNVPSERIAEFTKNVAMFGATTDVTSEAAATAFGRLDALLPDVQGNYEALGSSILKVGINSVATESEIISTTSQIAAAGAAAGMSADQVIGLSASFASLGVAPEAARGTVIRVLGLMNAAVAEGGEGLEAFANTAGISAKQFQDSWGTAQFTDSFVGFLRGIQSEGKSAQLALKELGIWAARDQNNLLKLSQNTETVVDIMADATSGFQNTGFMADQFGIKSETLAAKLQLLANNFQALVAQAGEVGGGALGTLVDGLNGVLTTATKLVDNPLAQWMTLSFGALAAFSGVTALAASGVGRVLASSLALQPVTQMGASVQAAWNTNMERAARAAAMQNTQLTVMQQRLVAARIATSGLATAAKTVGAALGWTAAFAAAGLAVSTVMDRMKSDTDRAKEAIGSFDGIMSATAADAKAAAEQYGSVDAALEAAGTSFSSLKVNLDQNNSALTEAEQAAALTEAAQTGLASAYDSTSESARQFTFVIGEQTRAALANSITSVEGMSEALLKLENSGFNATEYLRNLTTGNIDAARAQLDAFKLSADYLGQSLLSTNQNANEIAMSATDMADALKTVGEATSITSGAFADMAVQARIAEITGTDAGNSLEGSAAQFDFAGEAADELGGSIEALNGELASVHATANLGDAMANLIESFGMGAMASEEMGYVTLQSVDDIQKAVESSIQIGETMGYSAAQSVSELFRALQQEGVNTAAILSSLSGFGVKSLGGVSLKKIEKDMSSTRRETAQLGTYFTGLAGAARQVATQSTAAAGGIDKAGKAAKEAKVEIRSVVDYANDLSSVFARAFDLRYALASSTDNITKSFTAIRDRIEDARQRVRDFSQKIRELKAEGQSLAQDKAMQQYFLKIATHYKDTLRAAELTAKIGEIDAKIAKNKDDLVKAGKDQKKAQDEASLSLKGNSSQAIKNREDLRSLVKEYENQIAKLAESGLSQQELSVRTEQLRKDFERQAIQLGYNRADVQKLGASFRDYTAIVKAIPRNVTTSLEVKGMNPATAAIREFTTKANANLKSVNDSVNNLRKNSGGGVKMPLLTNPTDAREVRRMALETEIMVASAHARMMAAWNPAGALVFAGQVAGLRANLRYGNYWSGGFTGRGGKFEPRGEVHAGEYVVEQANVDQSTGKPKMEWLTKMLGNTAAGAGSSGRIESRRSSQGNSGVQRVIVINPVDLGIDSLHALANSGGGEVVIDSQQLSNAVNKVNVKNNQIGAS